MADLSDDFRFADPRRGRENDIEVWIEIALFRPDPNFPLKRPGNGDDASPLAEQLGGRKRLCRSNEVIYP